MTNMRERIARAMLAKDYPDDVGGEMEHLWWDRHGETYLAYADAAMSVYSEVTRDHQFPDDVRDLAVKVMVENTLPFMSDYMCAAILAERERCAVLVENWDEWGAHIDPYLAGIISSAIRDGP